MAFAPVEKPVAGPEAFEQTTDAAVLSQAAIILGIGARLHRKLDVIPADELSSLSAPKSIFGFELGGEVIDPTDARGNLIRKLGERSFPADLAAPVSGRSMAEILRILEEEPNALWTAGLFESALRNPNEIVRVAAAGAYHSFTPEKDRLVQILMHGTFSDQPLVRDLAATGLVQVDPLNARITGMQSRVMSAGAGEATHTSLLVHGTFARQASWWQPGGDFHSYLAKMLPTLSRDPRWDAPYGATDRFDWTGGYSSEARIDAADQLLNWVHDHVAEGLDLITHSYGGNVVMLATNRGLDTGELVLLSCPVLPSIYFPDFTRVRGRVVSIRVRMDLVLLLDSFYSGGLPRFTDPRIEEHILDLWFDHTLTHTPTVWEDTKHNIPGMI